MAGKRIKGITIEIDGDTKGLDKSLSDVDKQLKTTKDDLKDVNKLLKFDPKNTELLQQKQELLKTAIADTKGRLEQLKTALAQMDASGVDKNSEAYRGLQREIVSTEAELKNGEKQLKQFGSVGVQQINMIGEELKKVGGKITDVGEDLSKKVTAPIAAVGAASLAAFSEVDKGMDAIVTKTGATGDSLASMQSMVSDLATSIPTDFETAGNAVGEVNTRFGLTGDALEDLSAQFIKFAQINGTDVSSSIDGVQKVMDAFRVSADQASGVLDLLNAVGQNTGISMDELESQLVSNATALQSLGINVGDSAALMGQLEKSGVDASTVFTGLTKVQKTAMESGVSMQDALTQALSSSTDAIDIFGSKAGPKLYSAFQNGTLSAQMFAASLDGESGLEDSLGSVSDTFEGTLDPIDQWQLTLNQLKLTGAEVGATLGSVLQPMLEKLSDAVKALGDWWAQLSPEMQSTIVTVALIAAAVGPLLVMLGNVVTAIGAILAAINPVTLTIAAIVAAIAGVIAIIENWGTICDWFSGVWQSFCDFVSGLLTTLGSFFTEKWEGIKTTITGTWDSVVKTTTEKFESIKKTVHDAVEKLKSFFNFDWKLPDIKLPHFSVTGSFSLKPLSVPHFSVDWYAKGGILTAPTIFGMQDSSLLGGGEAGPEAVLPIEKLKDFMNEVLDRRQANAGGDFNQVINIASPQELKPSEIARQTKNATQSVLAAMRGI
jgi:phage-related minor tail protein